MIAVAGGILLAIFILLMLFGFGMMIRSCFKFVKAHLGLSVFVLILVILGIFGSAIEDTIKPTKATSQATVINDGKPVWTFDGSHVVCQVNCN